MLDMPACIIPEALNPGGYKNMIYNKYKNNYKKILLNIETPCHDFIKKQASMHDISLTYLINKILNAYIKNCKEKIKNL